MLYGLTCYAEYVDDRKQKHVGRGLYIQQQFICVLETVLEKVNVHLVWNECEMSIKKENSIYISGSQLVGCEMGHSSFLCK